jgi:hypothetical protein
MLDWRDILRGRLSLVTIGFAGEGGELTALFFRRPTTAAWPQGNMVFG